MTNTERREEKTLRVDTASLCLNLLIIFNASIGKKSNEGIKDVINKEWNGIYIFFHS